MSGVKTILSLPINDRQYLLRMALCILRSQLYNNTNMFIRFQNVINDISNLSDVIHPLVVIGDSHSYLYNRVVLSDDGRIILPLHFFCGGGSATGLGRPNSKSNYGAKLIQWANQFHSSVDNMTVIFKFGQVDAEFVWVFRRIAEGVAKFSIENFDELCTESIASYEGFLRHMINIMPHSMVKICSIFPPALSDEEWQKGYVNAHIGFLEGDRELADLKEAVKKIEIPNKIMRTQLHRRYNLKLYEMCKRLRVDYIDDFDPFIDENGTVAQKFTAAAQGQNHHIENNTETQEIIAAIIRKVIV